MPELYRQPLEALNSPSARSSKRVAEQVDHVNPKDDEAVHALQYGGKQEADGVAGDQVLTPSGSMTTKPHRLAA
jgi:hypothetical protein